MKALPQLGVWIILSIAATLAGGCVERTVKVQTSPPGALVTINDEEIGASPVRFAFLWYGDYDIIVRKQGYETLKTHARLEAPWYQWPPFDLVAEALVPANISDEHEWPVFTLTPATQPTAEELVTRAVETRDHALFQEGSEEPPK